MLVGEHGGRNAPAGAGATTDGLSSPASGAGAAAWRALEPVRGGVYRCWAQALDWRCNWSSCGAAGAIAATGRAAAWGAAMGAGAGAESNACRGRCWSWGLKLPREERQPAAQTGAGAGGPGTEAATGRAGSRPAQLETGAGAGTEAAHGESGQPACAAGTGAGPPARLASGLRCGRRGLLRRGLGCCTGGGRRRSACQGRRQLAAPEGAGAGCCCSRNWRGAWAQVVADARAGSWAVPAEMERGAAAAGMGFRHWSRRRRWRLGLCSGCKLGGPPAAGTEDEGEGACAGGVG